MRARAARASSTQTSISRMTWASEITRTERVPDFTRSETARFCVLTSSAVLMCRRESFIAIPHRLSAAWTL